MSNHRPCKFNSQDDATDSNNSDNNQQIRYMRHTPQQQQQQQYTQMQLQQAQLQECMQRMQSTASNNPPNNQNVQYLQVNINNNQFDNFVPPGIKLRLQPLPIQMQRETGSPAHNFLAPAGMPRTIRASRQDAADTHANVPSLVRDNFAFARPMPTLRQQWNNTSAAGANNARLLRRQSVCVGRPTATAERSNVFHLPRHLGVNTAAASSSTIAAASSSSMVAASSSTGAAAVNDNIASPSHRNFEALDLSWFVSRNDLQLQQDIERVCRRHALKEAKAVKLAEHIADIENELVSQENIEEQELNSEEILIVTDGEEDAIEDSVENFNDNIIDTRPKSPAAAEYSFAELAQLQMQARPAHNFTPMVTLPSVAQRRMPARRQTIMEHSNTPSVNTDFLRNLSFPERTARDDCGVNAKRFRNFDYAKIPARETNTQKLLRLPALNYNRRLSPTATDGATSRAHYNNMRQAAGNSDSEDETHGSAFPAASTYKNQYKRYMQSQNNNMQQFQTNSAIGQHVNMENFYNSVETTPLAAYQRAYNRSTSPEHYDERDVFPNNKRRSNGNARSESIDSAHSRLHNSSEQRKRRKYNENKAQVKKTSRDHHKKSNAAAIENADCVTFVIYDQGDESPHGSIPKSYHKRLEEEFNKLLAQHLLSDKKSENEHIQLIDSGFVNDFYCIRVSSSKFMKDLQDIVNALPNLWEGCSFNLMRKDSAEQRFEVACVLPFASGDLEFTNFIKILQKQNPKINTASWGLNGKRVVKKGHLLRITVDKHSYDVLQELAPLYFLAYRLKFKIGELIFQWKSSTSNLHEVKFSNSSEEDEFDEEEKFKAKKTSENKLAAAKHNYDDHSQEEEEEYDDRDDYEEQDADEEEGADEEQDADDEEDSDENRYSEEEYLEQDYAGHTHTMAAESQIEQSMRVAAECSANAHVQQAAKKSHADYDKEQNTDSDKEEPKDNDSDSSASITSDGDKNDSSDKDDSNDDCSDSQNEHSVDQQKDDDSLTYASYSGAEDIDKMQAEYLIEQQSCSSNNSQIITEIKTEQVEEEAENEEYAEHMANINLIKQEQDDVNVGASHFLPTGEYVFNIKQEQDSGDENESAQTPTQEADAENLLNLNELLAESTDDVVNSERINNYEETLIEQDIYNDIEQNMEHLHYEELPVSGDEPHEYAANSEEINLNEQTQIVQETFEDVAEDVEDEPNKVLQLESTDEQECAADSEEINCNERTENVPQMSKDIVDEDLPDQEHEVLLDEEHKQNKENNEPPNSEREHEQTAEALNINNNKIKLVEIKKLLDNSFINNMETNVERISQTENNDETDCNLLQATENPNNVLNEITENDSNSPKIDEEQ